MQLFVLDPDGTVLHCLPGYWDSNDLVTELGFAEELAKVWKDRSLSLDQKRKIYSERHLAHIHEHSAEMVKRSRMQGFDEKFEEKRKDVSDCIMREDSVWPKNRSTKERKGDVVFKKCDQIMHERLAKQPFVAYEKFDVVAFSDYGRPLYDKAQAAAGDVTKLEKEFGVDLPVAMNKRGKDCGGLSAAEVEKFLRDAGIDDPAARVRAHVDREHAGEACHCTCLHALAHESIGVKAKKAKSRK
jgi:hypothetical protein